MESIEFLPNGLRLVQDDAFFKLGQDSVLLSAFAQPRRFSRVLDLGAGTGALTLLAWRDDLTMTGLELQPEAAALFRRSVALNGLSNVQVLTGDLRRLRDFVPHGSIDYVLCNPPYFKNGAGVSAARPAHATAREDGEATTGDIAAAAAYALRDGGKCAMVFRPERLLTLLTALGRVRLTAKRLRFVHQRVDKPPSAVLIECRKGSKTDGLITLPPLLIEREDGTPTEEYLAIYRLHEA